MRSGDGDAALDRFFPLRQQPFDKLWLYLFRCQLTVQIEPQYIKGKLTSVRFRRRKKTRQVSQTQGFVTTRQAVVSSARLKLQFAQEPLPAGDQDGAANRQLLIPILQLHGWARFSAMRLSKALRCGRIFSYSFSARK